VTVFPEFVAGRHDDFPVRGWRVAEGSSQRGGASCNFTDRLLTVPLGPLPADRVVRAHELVHTRISPHTPVVASELGVHPRAVECAEEFRVNTVLLRLGFDVGQLCDGSERIGGARLAQSGQWDEALCFYFAVLGTGAEKPYLAGIRSERKEWVPAMQAVAKRARSMVLHVTTQGIGATEVTQSGLPSGYLAFTVPLAKTISMAMTAQLPSSSDELRRFRRTLEPGARRPPTGQFAQLVVATHEGPKSVRRRTVQRRLRPSNTGVVFRYPSRLLTDPQPRPFGIKQRASGGVILIDQSGSMDIDADDIEALLRVAPDSLVLGYSHRPGDLGATPNAWILADASGVVTSPPKGNVGNGVDGPALRWALGLRRPSETLVWVSDGQVTDANDHPCDSLSLECALLVRRHRIRMVRSLDQVESAFRGIQLPLDRFGRVGRVLQRCV